MGKKEAVVGDDGGRKIEQFWADNGNKVLALTVAVGAGAAALLLVKTFFDVRRRRKNEALVSAMNVPQFVEGARELGEDHGSEEVAQVAVGLAEQAGEGELSEALGAVAAIALEKKRKRN